MNAVEKDVIKCEAVFDSDKKHRFLLRRSWNKDAPVAMVITINPNTSTNLIFDATTQYTMNNIARLEHYGGVVMVNLYSRLTSKLDFKNNSPDELNHPENDEYILKAASEAEVIIIAYGKGIESNKHITERAAEVIKLLEPHRSKMKLISNGKGMVGAHPLHPSVRKGWTLVDFQCDKDN